MSHRWRIPKRGDDKEWEVLWKKVTADQDFYRAYHRTHALNQLSQIDSQLQAALKQKKETPAKINKLSRLNSKRKRVLKEYRGLIDDYESSNGKK